MIERIMEEFIKMTCFEMALEERVRRRKGRYFVIRD
jgi:hypothetical protein